jgi:alginate O-acetyltransferase complex protein AlgI
MAIGLGRMFGFEFLENFNYPYISASITEFWRRWHISLSTWFKEYVYIPLGGNRRGMKRQIVNIITVWLLTGLWHGASWNFVFWGGYYAVLLIAEKLFLLKWLKQAPKFLGHVYAMIAVMLGWALFYFEDMGALGAFLIRLFTAESSANAAKLMLGFLPLTLVAVVASTPLAKHLLSGREEAAGVRYGKIAACALAMVLCVAALASQSYNPFIYFRF